MKLRSDVLGDSMPAISIYTTYPIQDEISLFITGTKIGVNDS